MPPLPSLSGREVVLRSLIRAADLTVSEFVAAADEL